MIILISDLFQKLTLSFLSAITALPLMSVMKENVNRGAKMNLIIHYFSVGYKYKEILASLLLIHGIKLSLRQLKNIIKKQGLRRRTPESDLGDIIFAILEELSGSGKCIIYKTMWNRIKMKYGIHVHRSTVLRLMWIADPSGMERRKRHRLLRRKYSCPGPNFVWHIDGYDKLKPFGFSIHGAVDGFSRRILWLEVATSNNDPRVIARYFLQTINSLGGVVPTLIRSDHGTENVIVRQLQIFFRLGHGDAHADGKSFIVGKSTSNQRIESLWSMLRRQCIDFWINLFKDMRDTGLYNDGNIFHRQCLLYCFMPVIKCELRKFVLEWNLHYISSGSPNGKPEVMFSMPELYNSISHHHNIDLDDMQICTELYSRPLNDLGCLPEFFTLFNLIASHEGRVIDSANDAFNLYMHITTQVQ